MPWRVTRAAAKRRKSCLMRKEVSKRYFYNAIIGYDRMRGDI